MERFFLAMNETLNVLILGYGISHWFTEYSTPGLKGLYFDSYHKRLAEGTI